MKRLSAILSAFNTAGINPKADYHTLSSSQVETILRESKENKYRKPKNANGSTARMFFYAVQRAYIRERSN